MSVTQEVNPKQFQWSPQPAAEAWLRDLLGPFVEANPQAKAFANRLRIEAGVRFIDLVSHISIDRTYADIRGLRAAGWAETTDDQFINSSGIFPQISLSEGAFVISVGTKVESVADFLAANGLERHIYGEPGAAFRSATISELNAQEWYVVENHGSRPRMFASEAEDVVKVLRTSDTMRMRRRDFPSDEEGFRHCSMLINEAIGAVSVDRACDLFFAAEREYWQRRNLAAQVQKARQDKLGIGWANHDHHTYRSSRQNFTKLIGMWEKLGFHCRERFYAGREAGWGAQIMEQPNAGIVTFNDVDLSPDELTTDFAHEPLPPRDSLGTVGLWCALHSESFLQAGMHHLECQFDFDALKQQLESQEGVKVMKPFTNYPYLRQAFTEGERWPVDPKRIDGLLKGDLISSEQAEQFRVNGAIGSHLENLERNQGFKGFNQKGVSEIIAATDPRRHLGDKS